MKITTLKKAFITASILAALGYAEVTHADSGGGVIDSSGTNTGAVDLAAVTCDSATAYLFGQIKDQSAPVPGLLLSFHIYKGNQMTTSTDSVSGDANYSPGVKLNGGPGKYYISATKTAAGKRIFTATWSCMTPSNVQTGTSIAVLQFQ